MFILDKSLVISIMQYWASFVWSNLIIDKFLKEPTVVLVVWDALFLGVG